MWAVHVKLLFHAPRDFRSDTSHVCSLTISAPLIFPPRFEKIGELLGLWREEFPKGMQADEYARKRKQLRNVGMG